MTKPEWLAWVDKRISDVGKGIGYVWLVCLLSFQIGGEFPDKYHAFASMAAMHFCYTMMFEKFSVGKHIENFLFVVVYGAGGTLAAFNEFIVGSDRALFNVMGPAPIFFACVGHFIAGVILRIGGAPHE